MAELVPPVCKHPAQPRRRTGRTQIEFVHLSHPDDAVSWRRQVRVHAARNPTNQAARGRGKGVKAPELIHRSELESGRLLRDRLAGQTLRTPLSAASRDPFNSLVRPISFFESFLIQHFVHHAVSNPITCLPLRNQAERDEFARGMATSWIQFANSDVDMLESVFLVACRSLAENFQDGKLDSYALHYRIKCINGVNKSLSREGNSCSDLTITKTLVLGSEALHVGDVDSCIRHFEAAKTMVKMRGGPQTLGMGGFLGKIVVWFTRSPEGTHGAQVAESGLPMISEQIAGFSSAPVNSSQSQLTDIMPYEESM